MKLSSGDAAPCEGRLKCLVMSPKENLGLGPLLAAVSLSGASLVDLTNSKSAHCLADEQQAYFLPAAVPLNGVGDVEISRVGEGLLACAAQNSFGILPL